jgi:uncharacterized repeat protein (TIGR04138 family)
MQDLEFTEIVGLICKEDTRFDRKAYAFVRQALDQTVKDLKRKNPERTGKSQHVTGSELLRSIRAPDQDRVEHLGYCALLRLRRHRLQSDRV